jgi:hypothetical protein
VNSAKRRNKNKQRDIDDMLPGGMSRKAKGDGKTQQKRKQRCLRAKCTAQS